VTLPLPYCAMGGPSGDRMGVVEARSDSGACHAAIGHARMGMKRLVALVGTVTPQSKALPRSSIQCATHS